MKEKMNRRNFLRASSLAGFVCCGMLFSNQSQALTSVKKIFDDELIDPAKLNYCGYKCPPDCKFKEASVKNDTVLLKEAYNLWDIKNRYGVEFNPEKVYCFGCKKPEKEGGVVVDNCTVRTCAIEKGYESCIQCDKLKTCDKDLWNRFPKFHEQVVNMQAKFIEQKG